MFNFFNPTVLSQSYGALRLGPLYDDDNYYDEIEANLSWLIDTSEEEPLIVDAQLAYVYKGDLYGLLARSRAPIDQIPIIARMNGYRSSGEYDGIRTTFVLPAGDKVAHLNRLYRTRFS